MNTGNFVRFLVLLLLPALVCYAADRKTKELEKSLSILVAEGGALDLPTLSIHPYDLLPDAVPSVRMGFPRSKTIVSSSSRRSSDEERDHDIHTVDSVTLSGANSAENSPTNKNYQKILARSVRDLTGPIKTMVASLPTVHDKDEKDDLAKRVLKNTVAPVMQALKYNKKPEVQSLVDEQSTAELDFDINEVIKKDECCTCVIL